MRNLNPQHATFADATSDREGFTAPDLGRHESVVIVGATVMVAFAVLVIGGRVEFLPYHSIIEFLVAAVSLSVFFVSWHSRRLVDDDFLTVLGIGQLFVAVVTVFHLLGYNRMGVFAPADAQLGLGSQFWIISRALQGAVLLAACRYIGASIRHPVSAFAAFGIPSAIAVASVFMGEFPATNVAGVGLTPFKVRAEMIIVATMLTALWLLWRKRDRFAPRVFFDLGIAIALMIVAELMFMVYKSPFDVVSIAGHLVHLASVYFIYRGLVARALEDPFSLMFRRLGESEDRFRTVIQSMQDGVSMFDLKTERYVLVNDTFVELTGFTMDELNTISAEEAADRLHPDDRRRDVGPRRLSLTDEAPDPTVDYRWKVKNGEYRWFSDKRTIVRDSSGDAVALVSVSRDITDDKRREEELAHAAHEERTNARLNETLASIDQFVHATFDREKVLDKVLPEVVSATGADSALVVFRADDDWVIQSVYGISDSVRGLRMSEEDVPLTTLVASAAEQIAIEDTATHPSAGSCRLCEIANAKSMLLAPVIVGGKTLGVVVQHYLTRHEFSQRERFFADRLCSSVALALANIELFETEHLIAETLQETLVALPHRVAGISFSSAYESATYQHGRVGGDFVDVFELHGHWVGVTLGDVSGKGIEAAVTTSLIRNTLRVHALDGLSPAEVVGKANMVMRRFTEVESFATLWFGLLNTRTGMLRYVCAGHPAARVISECGFIRELECLDPIVGAFEDATFSEAQAVLVTGDRLVLHSDGVTEARSSAGVFFGEEGLMGMLERRSEVPTAELADAIMQDVIHFSDGVLRDDAAILAVEPVRLRIRAEPDSRMQAF